MSCLRSWFQRHQTCPTCRLNVLRAPEPQPTPAAAAPPPQMPPQNAGLPPMFAFPAWQPPFMPPMPNANLQQPPNIPSNYSTYLPNFFRLLDFVTDLSVSQTPDLPLNRNSHLRQLRRDQFHSRSPLPPSRQERQLVPLPTRTRLCASFRCHFCSHPFLHFSQVSSKSLLCQTTVILSKNNKELPVFEDIQRE